MTTPTIPDVPTATNADDCDVMLLRQPGTSLGIDRQVSVALLRQINIAGLSPIPSNPLASDLMLIQRGTSRHQIRFEHVSVPSGTKMWFYHNAEADIPGWSLFESA